MQNTVVSNRPLVFFSGCGIKMNSAVHNRVKNRPEQPDEIANK